MATRIVTRTVNTAANADARKAGNIAEREWAFDFEGVSDEEILELATDSAVIIEQRRFRKNPEAFSPTGQTFMVADVLKRSPRGPAEPLKRYLATLGIVVADEAAARSMIERMAKKAAK